jgi:hypothetical protein
MKNDKTVILGMCVLGVLLAVMIIKYELDNKSSSIVQEEVVADDVEVDFDPYEVYQNMMNKASSDESTSEEENNSSDNSSSNEYRVGDLSEEDIQKIFGDYLEKVAKEKAEKEASKNGNSSTDDDSTDTYYTAEDFVEYLSSNGVSDEEESESETEEVSSETVESEPVEVEDPSIVPTIVPEIIFDTDYTSDVDDAFALDVLLNYHRKGYINLIGVSMVSSRINSLYAASALCEASGITTMQFSINTNEGLATHSSYVNEIASEYNHSYTYYDNVSMYKQLLFSAQGKVSIIAVGQLNVLYRVLCDPIAFGLLQTKGGTLYWVGSKYTGGEENNTFYGGDNVERSEMIRMSKYVLANYPGDIAIIPADAGNMFAVGQFLKTSDKESKDIMARALELYGGTCTAFDPMGAFVAVTDIMGNCGIYGLSWEDGALYIQDSGGAWWSNNPNYKHKRLVQQTGYSSKFYQDQINSLLTEEYTIRTGKSVVW